MLDDVGIDTSVSTLCSTRSAVALAAGQYKAPINVIMAVAGWSKHSTYACFYNKHITSGKSNSGQAVMDHLIVKD